VKRLNAFHVIPPATLILLLVLFSGCGHPKQARVEVPPPPAAAPEPSSTGSSSTRLPAPPSGSTAKSKKPGAESGEEEADLAEPVIPGDAKPLSSETGRASWYGPPYHNRRGSNGEVYNMHAMTAAHRTLALGSIVRVTNLKTGSVALLRITDRGPFIPGRILDVSLAAARKLDIYQPGVAEVKVELMQGPAAAAASGKWAVQIGGFPEEATAKKLSDHLKRRYQTAQVLCFKSPAGDWWVRVRVLDDDHKRAQKLMAETETTEGAVFLVRLD
jgi:rare lipoprotein A